MIIYNYVFCEITISYNSIFVNKYLCKNNIDNNS